MSETVDIRCPYSFGRLFAKIKIEGGPLTVTPDGLFEVACSDCLRDLRQEGNTRAKRVLHYFNFIGEYVSSEVMY